MLTDITNHICKLCKNLYLRNAKEWFGSEQLELKWYRGHLKRTDTHTHTQPWMRNVQ